MGRLVFALLTLAGASIAQAQSTRSATLDDLRARPADFVGQRVSVAGQLNMCWNMDCKLCPLEATPRSPQPGRCLAVDFDRFRARGNEIGASMEPSFRYSDVILTARFDPACLKDVCLDRASVLLDARVETVTRRRRSSEGLIAHPDPLLSAPRSAVPPILDLLRGFKAGESPVPARAFTTSSDPLARHNAIVCISWTPPGQPVEWPTSFQGALLARSTEDTYRCWEALKDRQGWALVPSW
jgi:hypothetical protein